MTNNKPPVINVYSHGFGVRQDAVGIFTALAAALPEMQHVLFDYNVLVPNHPDIVTALPQQAELLLHKTKAVRAVYPDAVINLIGHSQGCVAIALANPDHIQRAIFIAPTVVLDAQRTINRVGSRPGSSIDIDGVSRVVRSNGNVNLIPAAHWAALGALKPLEDCKKLAAKTKTVAFVPDQDEVLAPPALLRAVPFLDVQMMAADHDFTGEARQHLLTAVKKVLDDA